VPRITGTIIDGFVNSPISALRFSALNLASLQSHRFGVFYKFIVIDDIEKTRMCHKKF